MGKKRYTQEQKETAIARLTLGESPTKIARDLKIPYGTVAYWKANLIKVKEQDGTLGYHSEETRQFVKKGWKASQILMDKLIKAAKDVEIKTPGHIKDIVSSLGTLLSRIEKVTPQPQLPAGERKLSLPDTSDWSVEELEIAHIKLKKIIADSIPQLENGEVIEGESREIN